MSEPEPVIVDRIDNTPCEIKYVNESGKTVGYWEYGHWCPDYPYQGDMKEYQSNLEKYPWLNS